jgi:urease accessory protein
MQLTDASLPTGGFAHSGGLEAAVQLGVVPVPVGPRANPFIAEAALVEFVEMAIISTAEQQTPFVLEAHEVMSRELAARATTDEGWSASAVDAVLTRVGHLDAKLDALLAPVTPAHRASRLQGSGLTRVAGCWLDSSVGDTGSAAFGRAIFKRRSQGHAAVAMGLLAASLDLPAAAAVEALLYCQSRDILAAAIRLNVIGPLRATMVQVGLSGVAANVAAVHVEVPSGNEERKSTDSAAGTAPLLDTVHAVHDVLEMRLFQT